MFYLIRSNSSIPKGPYTWISNFCVFTLFLVIIFVLFLGLVYTTPTNIDEDAGERHHLVGMDPIELSQELSALLSIFVSKVAMFPLLVLEVTIYVSLNCRLLWMWYRTSEWDTIVNKFLFINRICGILYMVGCPVDFWLRLYGQNSFILIS